MARYYNMYYLIIVAVAVSFDQLTYFANEDNGTVELMVILSNPSIADITVQIVSSDVTAISKCAYTLHLSHFIAYVHTYSTSHTIYLHVHMHTYTY